MTVIAEKGKKIDLLAQDAVGKKIMICLGWEMPNEKDYSIDSAAFLLQVNGKVIDDNDFIFYNNPKSSNGAIVHKANKEKTMLMGKEQITIDVSMVDKNIDKISFTITIHEADIKKQNFKEFTNVFVKVIDAETKEEYCTYNICEDLKLETAIVACEIYRKGSNWKFAAIGSGFVGGLNDLCTKYGIDVVDEPITEVRKETPIILVPKETPIVSTTPKGTSKVNLSKIELKKKGDTISLEKKNDGKLGDIVVNLNWSQKKKTGFWGAAKGTDLDLGCLYELNDGTKRLVQALGKAFGDYTKPPYISLDNDDRSGTVTTGENLRINGNYLKNIKRILVYAFIYEGLSNWSQADGCVTIKQDNGPDIVINLDEHSSNKTMCAVALITNENNQTFKIERLVQYFSGHIEMDKAFGWGLKWTTGKK
ncbi:TerD domain-containing protein [Clostridium estertheticum]|uniref:TerD family protein n=1 Tax=Clostridium estertheticum TaxID=238834 RepID=UPI0013E96165|nr:TerD family protein [Clostridium estertheticum]MBZ9686412.1 TerD domain-containing protein [Clostridium estertheticum]